MSRVKVRYFGEARIKQKVAYDYFEAETVKDLLGLIAEKSEELTEKELRDFLIFVNNVSITKLKMFRTKLSEGDEIMFLSPASGG